MLHADTPSSSASPANVTELPRAPIVRVERTVSAFTPLMLTSLALVAWLGFQAAQQFSERAQLAALDETSAVQEQAANKVRHSLEAVAAATARLSAAGNDNARVVVEELRKRGVTINPNGAAKSPAP